MDKGPIIVIAISELVALWLIVRVWRTSAHVAEKVGVTVVALLPVIGPVLALFLTNDSGPAHPAFRDNLIHQTDVLDRWRQIFEEKDPVSRRRKWKTLMGIRNDDEPN